MNKDTCIVSGQLKNNESFQRVKVDYAKRGYNDDTLAQAIQMCREAHNYDSDWYPNTPAEKAVFTRFLNSKFLKDSIKKTASTVEADDVYNLYTTLYSIYTPTQLHNRVNMIATEFRKRLTQLQKEGNPWLTRQQVLIESSKDGGGVRKIFDDMKRYYSLYTEDALMSAFRKARPYMSEEDAVKYQEIARYRASEYKTVLDNWNRLSELACIKIGEDEGLVIRTTGSAISFEEYTGDENTSIEGSESEKEDNTTELTDKDDSSKGERFMDFRTLKLMNTLSARCKRLLSSIPMVDSNGKKMSDDIGVWKCMNPRQAAVVLRRVICNSTPESMMSDIESAISSNPWMRGLYDMLNTNKEYRQTIYCNFKKAATTYVYTEYDRGEYTPKIANSRASGYSMARDVYDNFRSGFVQDPETSIYLDGTGELKPLEEINKIKDRAAELRNKIAFLTKHIGMISGDTAKSSDSQYMREYRKQIEEKYNISSDYVVRGRDAANGEEAMEASMKMLLQEDPSIAKELASLLRGLGFEVSADDVTSVALQTMNAKGFKYVTGGKASSSYRNKLFHLIDKVESLYRNISVGYQKLVRDGDGMASYLFENKTEQFTAINKVLALARYDELEERVTTKDSTLSTYNNVNLAHQMIDMLSNTSGVSEEEYQKMIEREFLQYEGYSLGYGNETRFKADSRETALKASNINDVDVSLGNNTDVDNIVYAHSPEAAAKIKAIPGMTLMYEQRKANGFLKELRDNPESRSRFKLVNCTSFNHKEYAKLSRTQKLANSIVMFFNYYEGNFVELPIQSDYSTAYDFIRTSALSHDSIVDELTNEVLIECERIDAIQRRQSFKQRPILKVYEQQGENFQIFPWLNKAEILAEYSRYEDPQMAKAFIRTKVEEALRQVVSQDWATIDNSGVLSHPSMKRIRGTKDGFYVPEDKYSNHSELSKEAQEKLENMFENVFYVREQMTKILTGGLEHFSGLIEYEKRNMMVHTTRTSLYTEAWYDGLPVGKKSENVVYIGDYKTKSKYLSEITEMCDALLKQGVISRDQYVSFIDSYKNINVTDGQGLRTLESFRDVSIMNDDWDRRHETAYKRILAGNPRKQDIAVFMQNKKPMLTGFESIPAYGERQKPIKATVLHKYSEQVLLPLALAKYCLQANSPYNKVLQSVADNASKKIDLFLFSSCVKVGAHTVLEPFKIDDNGLILDNTDDMRKFMLNEITSKPWCIHNIPYKYYGISASTPAHAADDNIAWAAQAEKNVWANIAAAPENYSSSLNEEDRQKLIDRDAEELGEVLTIRGRKMTSAEAREQFFRIKEADIVSEYSKLKQIFKDSDQLEKIFQEELLSKSYTSSELRYALAHLKSGDFALPLFSPNVVHEVEQILSSIIRKRLTKPMKKGANILQATSLGLDEDAHTVVDNIASTVDAVADHIFGEGMLYDSNKLRVVFDGEGKNRRIKYVEVFVPIHDSRLLQFANEDGVISPSRLNKLVEDGVIPESMLEFVAYRTPSDAEHSIIPCRIKGFLANTGGATIIMPKEIMKMTGHDYDGDKMRCHFKNFSVVDKEGNDINVSTADMMKMVLGTKDINSAYRKCVVPEYDYSRSELDNSQEARDNARIELMFAKMTSPAGSRRMIIPGGNDESTQIAKTLAIIDAVSDNPSLKEKIAKELTRKRAEKQYNKYKKSSSNPDSFDDYVKKNRDSLLDFRKREESFLSNTEYLYNNYKTRSDGELSDILRIANSSVSAFSLTHSADAFDYIMGGSSMISVYALYNSAFAMLQRANLYYVPRKTKSGKNPGKPYRLSMFGHSIVDANGEGIRLFNVNNHAGLLAILGLSRLLNAAVDNNKNPILGYLNQNSRFSEITFFMFAAGFTEEEIHLFFNQPAIKELTSRLSSYNSSSITDIADQLIEEIGGEIQNLEDINNGSKTFSALNKLSGISKSAFIQALGKKYSDMESEYLDYKELQICVLHALKFMNGPANNLSKFVRAMRPDSEGGGIGAIADIIAKLGELEDIRSMVSIDDWSDSEEVDESVGISGIRNLVRKVDIKDADDPKYIMDKIEDELCDVEALNTLMIDNSLPIFSPYFPQAKESWYKTALSLSKRYRYTTPQENLIKRISYEMILFKLLNDSEFIQQNPQEEQKKIINDTPENLIALKRRILNVENQLSKGETVTDTAALALSGNIFLNKLTLSKINDTQRRIQFRMNGPAAEGMADDIRASWSELLNSEDESIKQLALDLFKYNLYTNGLLYGMFEFSHFAPFPVLMSCPGYVPAMRRILDTDWSDPNDAKNGPDGKYNDTYNFINQYYMNHWGDERFLYNFEADSLPRVDGRTDVKTIVIKPGDDDYSFWKHQDYVIIEVQNRNENGRPTGKPIQFLHKVECNDENKTVALTMWQKAGVRDKNGQKILQYNPYIDFDKFKPVIEPNELAWGAQVNRLTRKQQRTGAEGNIDESTINNDINAGSSIDSQVSDQDLFHAARTGNKSVQVEYRKQVGKIKLKEEKAEENIAHNEKQVADSNSKNENNATPVVQKHEGNWSREEAQSNPRILYVFTDNTDRDSGSGEIPADSWYSKKYGEGHHYPTRTAAVIRGLDNARPISTQKWFHDGAKGPAGNWTDDDVDEFKRVIKEELEEIVKEFKTGKYDTIMFPDGDGLFNARISNITMERTPELYQALADLLHEFNFDFLIPADVESSTGFDDKETMPEQAPNPQPGQYESLSAEDLSLFRSGRAKLLNIVSEEDGKVLVDKVPVTPRNTREAEKQRVFVELNKKLREILREAGIDTGVLTDAEAMMSVGGVADFDSAEVTAEGLKVLIRLAQGYAGDISLPEEFAHVAIEMLGHEHPLVKRLLEYLSTHEDAMQEAFGGLYDEYAKRYSKDIDKLVLEAAGKLLAKQLFRQEELESKPVKRLLTRIWEAIKNLLSKIRIDAIQNAIFDAKGISSKMARDILGGKMSDLLHVENISQTGTFQSVKTDISNKEDILSKMLEISAKRLSIIKKRLTPEQIANPSGSYLAVQNEVDKLQKAMTKYQTESAIINYMNDSLDFLEKMEKSLNDTLDSGGSSNVICQKLLIVQDILYSYSEVMSAVNDAIVSGEIENSKMLSDAKAKVNNVLSEFFIKYEKESLRQAEILLQNIYGENGITIEVGKDKGKHLSIEDLATKSQRDISVISRLLNSVADCDDFMLQALDDVTRDAKMRGRSRTNDARRKIEVAIADLIRETGSNDQTFMFEYITGKDGKKHKTGKYISVDSAEYARLSEAQKKYYNRMTEIKKDIDKYVPTPMLSEDKIVMMRKYDLERVKAASGLQGKALVAWDNLKNRVMDTSDNFDPEYYEVAVDFQNNKVDKLPLKFLFKGKNETYDDMTDDVAQSMLAYAGMAYEYDELNNVICTLENAKYVAARRKFIQRTGNRIQRETIDTDPESNTSGVMFRKPYTRKDLRSEANKALQDFFAMHVYGHIRKNEGTFGNTRIDKRKTVDTLNSITSLTQMALNLPQRIKNVSVGATQIFIETKGRGKFTGADWRWAVKTWTTNTADRLKDAGVTDYDNKLSLFAEKFDLHQDNGRERVEYGKGRASRVINSSLLYFGLTAGEDFLALTTGLAMAHNYKVKGPDGKTYNLWDAYEVKYTDDANKTGAFLMLKPGFTKMDGSAITAEDERKYSKNVAAMNFEMQGIYNLDDKSAIQQYAFGALLIMYRKWMAPSIKRRYGRGKYSVLKGEFEEGYYRTLLGHLAQSLKDMKTQVTEDSSSLALLNIFADIKALSASCKLNRSKLTEYELSNLKRAWTELSIIFSLFMLCWISDKMIPDKNDDNELLSWAEKQWWSQLLMLRTELAAQAPTPLMVDEAMHILKSPFAALGPIKSTLNGFKLLTPGPYLQNIKSGRYKGHTKAYKYFRELPVIAAFKKIENFVDPSPLINYYRNDATY